MPVRALPEGAATDEGGVAEVGRGLRPPGQWRPRRRTGGGELLQSAGCLSARVVRCEVGIEMISGLNPRIYMLDIDK